MMLLPSKRVFQTERLSSKTASKNWQLLLRVLDHRRRIPAPSIQVLFIDTQI